MGWRTGFLVAMTVAVLAMGCGGDDTGGGPTPGCVCTGAVPGGTLDVACGASGCVAGVLYSCTGPNMAEPTSACGLPDAGMDSSVPPMDSSVPMDTSPPPMDTSPPPPTGCSVTIRSGGGTNDTCTGDEICYCPGGAGVCDASGTCERAFDRNYAVLVISLSVVDRQPDGSCWDAACGAPDPYVTASANGVTLGTPTPAAADIYEGTYDPPARFDFLALRSTVLRVDAWDEDLTDDDLIVACGIDPVTTAFLRGRTMSCNRDGTGSGLEIAIVPVAL